MRYVRHMPFEARFTIKMKRDEPKTCLHLHVKEFVIVQRSSSSRFRQLGTQSNILVLMKFEIIIKSSQIVYLVQQRLYRIDITIQLVLKPLYRKKETMCPEYAVRHKTRFMKKNDAVPKTPRLCCQVTQFLYRRLKVPKQPLSVHKFRINTKSPQNFF